MNATRDTLVSKQIYCHACLRNKTNKMHFLYVFYSEKRPLHVSNRQALHPQDALFTVYA